LTFFELRFSFSFLRTTPARNPRTECCCQPVAFIIVAIVVPSGDRSIARTRDCFEPGSAFLFLLFFGLPVVWGEGFAAGARAADALDEFFANFDIEILRSVECGIVAAPPTPHLGDEAGGAGSLSAHALGI
jgi:hypothetical protein